MNFDPSDAAPGIVVGIATSLLLAVFPSVARWLWRAAKTALQVSTFPLRILLPPYRRKWPECCGTRMRVHDDGKNPARARLRCAKCGTWRYVKAARVRAEALTSIRETVETTTGSMRGLGVTAEEAGEALLRMGEGVLTPGQRAVDAYVYENECERDIFYAHLLYGWSRSGCEIEITEVHLDEVPRVESSNLGALVIYPEDTYSKVGSAIEFNITSIVQESKPGENTVRVVGFVTRDHDLPA